MVYRDANKAVKYQMLTDGFFSCVLTLERFACCVPSIKINTFVSVICFLFSF